MIDIKTLQQALYLSLIPKLIEKVHENNLSWKTYPVYLFSKISGPGLAIINTPCKSKDLIGMPKTAGVLWSTMLHAWFTLKAKHDDENININPNSPFWNNNNLQYKQKKI